jgi:hypothetical protein
MFSKVFRLIPVLWFLPLSLLASEWAPFVIPERLAADSPILWAASAPIDPDHPRLKTANGYFVEEQNPARPVRIWGVNLCFGANLPTAPEAERLAARLAGAGINSVRIHHLDTDNFPRGIWNPDQEGKTIDPRALERLDALSTNWLGTVSGSTLFSTWAVPHRALVCPIRDRLHQIATLSPLS